MHILLDICLSPNTIVFVLSVFIISPYLIASLCSEWTVLSKYIAGSEFQAVGLDSAKLRNLRF